jgi:hypothetical protein
MGIRRWLEQRREKGDADAVKRAEDEMYAGSPEERDIIAGDMEGRASDARAEGRMGEASIRDVDRLGGF